MNNNIKLKRAWTAFERVYHDTAKPAFISEYLAHEDLEKAWKVYEAEMKKDRAAHRAIMDQE